MTKVRLLSDKISVRLKQDARNSSKSTPNVQEQLDTSKLCNEVQNDFSLIFYLNIDKKIQIN